LKWNSPEKYYIESQDGQYRIAKAYVRGKPRYTIFRKKGKRFILTKHPATDSFKEAEGLIDGKHAELVSSTGSDKDGDKG